MSKIELTKREIDIMELLIVGNTKNDIAKELGISYHTVKRNVEHIYEKFGVCNKVQAAIKYLLLYRNWLLT